jgi:ubiquinone/menaquinone biosynthesis C-methylase UbiE
MNNNDPSRIEHAKQRLSGIFSQLAVTYDRVGPRYFSYFGRRLVEHTQIPSGGRVLDVATGRGAVLFPAAERVGSQGHVVGIDLTQAMVLETGQELANLDVPNAEVRQMDAENLQFPDQVFDRVLCGFAIFFFPQPYQALSEFHRVLKPGGRIGLTTFDKLFYEQWRWFDDLVEGYIPPEPGSNQPAKSPSPQQPEFDKPEGLEVLLTATGFANIQIISETNEFVYADEEEYWSTLWSLGIRATLQQIEKERGQEGLLRFKVDVWKRLQAFKGVDGIHQPFSVLFAVATKPPT